MIIFAPKFAQPVAVNCRAADMVKLVDMPDLGSGAARRVGSSPIIRTFKISKTFIYNGLEIFYFIP